MKKYKGKLFVTSTIGIRFIESKICNMKRISFLLAMMISVMILHAQQTPQDSLQQYTGKYKFPDGSVVTEITVTIENGVLYANSVMGSSELRKAEKDIFEIVAYAGSATFKRDTVGKVTGVQIVVGDINMEGTKTEGLTLNNNSITLFPNEDSYILEKKIPASFETGILLLKSISVLSNT
jgi:hypothetical protein